MEQKILDHIDSIEKKEDRIEFIDDLLHRLHFERRLLSLTDEELQHMNDDSLNKAQIDAINACKTEKEREEVINGYARAKYFRECAWQSYLNGETEVKPYSSPCATQE